MAIFFDGFEQFDKAPSATELMRRAGYTCDGGGIGSGVKPGGRCLALLTGYDPVTRPWYMAEDVLTVGLAVKFDERGGLFWVSAGTDKLAISGSTDTGLLYIGTEPGYVLPGKNRWYYFELVMDATQGTATLFVNGKPDIVVPLPSGFAQGANVIVGLEAGGDPNGIPHGVQYDDYYIKDGDRLNAVQIATRFPTSQQAAEWHVMSEVENQPNWEAVGTLPVELLDRFIYSDVDGAQDQYQSDTQLPDNNPVLHLGLVTLVRKATSDPITVTVNIDGATEELTTLKRDWEYRYSVFDATGYDESSVESAVFGVTLNNGA